MLRPQLYGYQKANDNCSLLFADRPLPPRNLEVSNIRTESCYLHWEAPLDNGGSELTNYIVERKDINTENPEENSDWVEVTNSIIEKRFGVRYLSLLSIILDSLVYKCDPNLWIFNKY